MHYLVEQCFVYSFKSKCSIQVLCKEGGINLHSCSCKGISRSVCSSRNSGKHVHNLHVSKYSYNQW